jgi:lysophospholipase L1-like esterase
MRLLALSLFLPASVLFAGPLTLRSQLQPGAPMTVEADAKEGVYLVTVVYGGDDVDSVTTMKAELRRVYEVNLHVPKGGSVKRTYRVSVHAPEIAGGGKVGLKSREVGTASWDDKLSLEFLGSAARVRAVTVEPDTAKPVVVRLLGDSTMTDSTTEPYYGWGQVFPVLFDDGVVIDNHAESGLALNSFQGSRRLTKVLSMLTPGDYVFIQFGHNDQKEKGEGVGAFTTYSERLRGYVKAIREKNGQPVIVTSVARRRFDDQGKVFESLGDFPEAARRVAKELGVPLIDLNESSKKMYQAMGAEPSKAVFLHIPATSKKSAIADDTHFSSFGAYEVGRCVSSELAARLPELAKHLRPEVAQFDPAHPDTPAGVKFPASRATSTAKPDGN